MSKYVAKTNIEAVTVIKSEDEDTAKKQIADLMKIVVEKLQSDNPSIKFTVGYFANISELPEEN